MRAFRVDVFPENRIKPIGGLRPTPFLRLSIASPSFSQRANKSELRGATPNFLPGQGTTPWLSGPAGDCLPPSFTELQKSCREGLPMSHLFLASFGYFSQ